MPESKGSENNFSQRDSDSSVEVDNSDSELEDGEIQMDQNDQVDAIEVDDSGEWDNNETNNQDVEYWGNEFIKRHGIEQFNKPITNRLLEAARKVEKPKVSNDQAILDVYQNKSKMCDIKSALMNLVHTITDEGIDDDTISKLINVINIAKDKVSALIKEKSTEDTSNKATMATRIRDINKPNEEKNQKKVLFADTVKKNIKTNDNKKIQQKTVSRKPIVFTEDQMLKVIDGQSLFESTKYKLVYFEGIQRCRAYQLGNVDWVTDTKLEVCINEKAAPQLVKRMDTIKVVTYNSIYNPIAAKEGEHSGLDYLKARLKWQTLDANRNKPEQRMARLITKITKINTYGFMACHVDTPESSPCDALVSEDHEHQNKQLQDGLFRDMLPSSSCPWIM
ncbi:hypothetical protein BB558_007186 [Smittium angustum]|uniref:Uncharacterized protein n=1 Tax=Smittium angustum TaxID=133377 RepID=A0A2U1IVQ0_SMIAN|nr:hypothetical protein BB558_007186 [Smittium angustum]